VRILGIDPGLSGGVAVYFVDIKRWLVIDLPTVGEGAQRRLNAPALRDWLGNPPPDHAFIESVQAMPSIPDKFGIRRGMGVASSFRFGRVTGAIEATVACCNIPITLVVPQSWKRFYGLRGSDKEASRALALRRFPTAASHLARKLDHGRAEAMLIAYFGASAVGAVRSMSPLDLSVN
jgi:crossover junction endodeoxyribonuclease RuvC